MSEGKDRVFFSLKLKMMFWIVLLIILIMAGVNGVITRDVRATILGESLDKGRAIANNIALIAEEAILTMDDTSLFIPLSKSVEGSKDIVYAYVTNKKGLIIAHNDISFVDTMHEHPEIIENLVSKTDYNIVSYIHDSKLVYNIESAVGDIEKLGTVHIGIAGSVVDDVVKETSKNILMLSVVGLLISALGALVLATFQVKPILLLVKGVKEIGEGHFDQKINIKRKDEIGALTTAFNDMAKGLAEREFIRQTFQKFVHKDVANQLLENPDMVKVGGERKKVTVIFTDIRGFTTMSENMNPEDLIGLLNSYFAELLPIIDKNGGVLDKFIGDAMMIVFGTPMPKEDDALRAVKTGLEMRAKVKELNAVKEKNGEKQVIMGIGINTGNVVAGNVGSEDRMEYTVLGDAVNIAARLEGQSRTGDVIISDATYSEVKDLVVAVKSDEKVSLKGKAEAVNIYTVKKML